MDFDYLLTKINQLSDLSLPGIEAHKKLVPFQRPLFNEYNIPENARKAGVLVLLYSDKSNQTQILLTKRAQYNGTHSNQISFPGGKKDTIDIDLEATALRETFEEVGLHENNVSIIKQLSSIYIPPSNFQVNPYIGFSKEIPVFTLNYEVEHIIHFPISELFNNNNLATFKTSTSYTRNIEVPCFTFENHHIWGATAMILNEVKEVLKNL